MVKRKRRSRGGGEQPHAHRLHHKGRTQSISQWARELGMKRTTILKRLSLGWSVHEALGTPIRVYGRGA